MAKETKTITVHPNHVQGSMDEHRIFGWDVMSVQEVKTVDSHLETRWDNLYNVTKTEHYIRLTYQRDPTTIPYYSELSILEQEYDSLRGPIWSRRSNLFSIISLIILGIGIFLLFACVLTFTQRELFPTSDLGSAGFLGVIGIGIITLRVVLHVKKNKQWDNSFRAYVYKQKELLEKAKKLQKQGMIWV